MRERDLDGNTGVEGGVGNFNKEKGRGGGGGGGGWQTPGAGERGTWKIGRAGKRAVVSGMR